VGGRGRRREERERERERMASWRGDEVARGADACGGDLCRSRWREGWQQWRDGECGEETAEKMSAGAVERAASLADVE